MTSRNTPSTQPVPSCLSCISDLTKLGRSIAVHGFGPHEDDIEQLHILAQKADVAEASAALKVLSDRTAPAQARSLAFTMLCATWTDVLASLDRKQGFDRAFAELLDAWKGHEELRASHAPIRDLVESRSHLDRVRRRVAAVRSRHLGQAA